jgi:Dyp-type peroxidase family
VELSGEYGRATGGRSQKAPFYEHFGFRDGISQPVIRGTQKEATAPGEADVVEAGELILGYRDSSRHIAPAITVAAEHDSCNDLETDAPDFPSRYPRFGDSHSADQRDFGRNGTFVVVRQFEQHVTEFNDFLERQKEVLSTYPGIEDSAGGPITAEWIAAKMMGRWRSGASLVRWAHAMPDRAAIDIEDNDFNFGQDDPQGLRCPLGAHIRRANPRGSLAPDDPKQAQIEKRHRLLRRGRPYEIEEDGKTKKGLVFVGLCADLERQFEFLQQSWIGEPNFHGLTNEPDPITATYHPTAETDANPGKRSQVFSIPTPSGPVTLRDLPSFVTVRAGGYFFMPGRSAIRFLGRL